MNKCIYANFSVVNWKFLLPVATFVAIADICYGLWRPCHSCICKCCWPETSAVTETCKWRYETNPYSPEFYYLWKKGFMKNSSNPRKCLPFYSTNGKNCVCLCDQSGCTSEHSDHWSCTVINSCSNFSIITIRNDKCMVLSNLKEGKIHFRNSVC